LAPESVLKRWNKETHLYQPGTELQASTPYPATLMREISQVSAV